jgi:hypothetical protein
MRLVVGVTVSLGRAGSSGHAELRQTCERRRGRLALAVSASRLALASLVAAGAASLSFSAFATNFNVGSDADLPNAVNNAANGDTITYAGTAFLQYQF